MMEKMMKILLVNFSKKTEVRIPQGLLYLASSIDSYGYDVEICDETFFVNQDEFENYILNHDASIVGLSVYSVPWQLKKAERLSGNIKNKDAEKIVIWGGWHATLYPWQSILTEGVDIVVKGPAEKIFCDLLGHLKSDLPLNQVCGILFCRNGKVYETPNIEPDEAELFPELNYDLIKLNEYLNKHDTAKGILQYVTSRGCYGGCKFCIMTKTFNRKLFRKPKDTCVRELKYLYDNHDVNAVYFSDDNAFCNDRQAQEICSIVKEVTKGDYIRWRCAVRVDTLSRLDDDTFKELKQTGCIGFSIGIESGNDEVLSLMGKGTKRFQINIALEKLQQYNFEKNLFFFLFNYDGETRCQAKQTLKLACNVRLLFPKSDIALYNYYPLMSDSSWFADVSLDKTSWAEEFVQKENRLNNKAAGIKFKVLRFYFDVLKHKGTNRVGLRSIGLNLVRKIARLRTKRYLFIFPFEYYVVNFIKSLLTLSTRLKNGRT